MNEILLIVIFVVWYLIGLYSFYYWWTTEYDIDTKPEILLIWIASGFIGIISWFIGWHIHSDKEIKYRTLFKKRK